MIKYRHIAWLAVSLLVFSLSSVRADPLVPTMGDDGLYHYDWYHQSFLDLRDDLADAADADKLLLVKMDQKGCIYCERLALEILTDPVINAYVREHFLVVQLDIFGGREVTDLDGAEFLENDITRHWGTVFTPTLYFLDPEKETPIPVPQAAVATMPGAFGKITFLGFLEWVRDKGYTKEEPFQTYYGKRFDELKQRIQGTG